MTPNSKSMLHKAKHVAAHMGHDGAHLVYFAAVFFEGHGLYSIMGGILCTMGTWHGILNTIGCCRSACL